MIRSSDPERVHTLPSRKTGIGAADISAACAITRCIFPEAICFRAGKDDDNVNSQRRCKQNSNRLSQAMDPRARKIDRTDLDWPGCLFRRTGSCGTRGTTRTFLKQCRRSLTQFLDQTAKGSERRTIAKIHITKNVSSRGWVTGWASSSLAPLVTQLDNLKYRTNAMERRQRNTKT
jgi:hypothetical protein